MLKLMEDLIDYFCQPEEHCSFEERNNCLRALRRRQDLFQEEGVLNMILDTIDKFSQMEALPDFARIIGSRHLAIWENISTYLYLLLAAMIKGNHTNCAQFAAPMRLDWLFGRLANPQSAEGPSLLFPCPPWLALGDGQGSWTSCTASSRSPRRPST